MRNRELVLKEIKSAVAEERASALRVLHLLREIDRDGHYLEMGFPSLFEFCTKELGYPEAAAQRRIDSMRLLRQMPRLEEKIANGTLSLTVAAKAQSFFRREDRKRREEGVAKLSSSQKSEIVESVLGLSTRECERKLIEISPESALPRERARPIAGGGTVLQFVASDELMKKIEKLKGLTAHKNFDGRIAQLIEILADMALKKLDPEQQTQKPQQTCGLPPAELFPAVKLLPAPETETGRASKTAEKAPSELPLPSQRSRHIPAAVKRRVWLRDGGRCSYTDPETGRRCESRHALQYDHYNTPFCWGGNSTETNLTLRCANHNAFSARKLGLMR